VAAASLFGKTKKPTAGLAVGSINLVNESEPDRRAAQQQRVWQQIQIQIAIHGHNITIWLRRVKLIFTLASCQPSPGNWRFMAWKRKISGGALVTIGFMLSPLSWWNDAFVNIPLALGFAWLVSFLYQPAFAASLIVGYWLTNVVGLVLMHKGARKMLSGKPAADLRRELLKDVIVSLIYTGVIVVLVRQEILKPFAGYFNSR
jgi:hypothetical protein